jgi:divalent metal cation (Fe/Co/Zn/Cd) transporter
VTLSVLASMAVTVFLGWAWADVIIALVVVVMILRAAWAIVRRTGTVLVDTAPLDPAEVQGLLNDIPSLHDIVRVRSRGDVDNIRVDVDVEVPREMTADQTAAVNEIVRQRLHDGIPGLTEVEVHFAPVDFQPDDHAMGVRILAESRGMRTHNLNFEMLDGVGVLDLHIEVPGSLSLNEAHDEVSQLEEQIRGRFPEIHTVVSHIEPLIEAGATEETRTCIEDPRLAQQILGTLRAKFPQAGWHNLNIFGQPRGLTVTLHAALPAEMSIEAAHDIAEEAERSLRTALPHIDRVTIHTEPGTVHAP